MKQVHVPFRTTPKALRLAPNPPFPKVRSGAHRGFDLFPAFYLAAFLLALNPPAAQADDWPQWRGPNRDGISGETGLLAEWPKDGPRLRWQARDLGGGYSTPAVVKERLFLMENAGIEDEFVRARSVEDGRILWSTRVGKVGNPDQQPPYVGARSTPTVDGDSVYALSSDGDLVCLDMGSGALRWHRSLRADFGGSPGAWAYSESPLIDGDRIVCTPGGSSASVVALDKKTGAPVWRCALPDSTNAAYASPIVVETGGVRQYVQLLEGGLVGIESGSGRPLWRYRKPVSRFRANIPTPVAGDGYVYAGSAGTGGGAVKLIARNGGVDAEEAYFEAKLPTAIGGSIKLGKYLYGTTGQAVVCVELATGELKWEERALAPASLCHADGRLYLHGENGEVALVEASPTGYRERGRFTPPEPPRRINAMEKAWAHPVVANGRLYIRDVSALWSYEVIRN